MLRKRSSKWICEICRSTRIQQNQCRRLTTQSPTSLSSPVTPITRNTKPPFRRVPLRELLGKDKDKTSTNSTKSTLTEATAEVSESSIENSMSTKKNDTNSTKIESGTVE